MQARPRTAPGAVVGPTRRSLDQHRSLQSVATRAHTAYDGQQTTWGDEYDMAADLATERRKYIAAELAPDEELLWAGGPDPSRIVSQTDWVLIPLSLLLLLFFIPNLSVTSLAPGFTGVLLVLLYVVGILVTLYLAGGRLYYKRLTRECTAYGITNERVLSVNTLWGKRTRCTPIHELATVALLGAGGTRTVTFTKSRDQSAWAESTGLPSPSIWRQRTVPALYDIAGAAEVYGLVIEQRAREKLT